MQAKFAIMQPSNVRAMFLSPIRSAICLSDCEDRIRSDAQRVS